MKRRLKAARAALVEAVPGVLLAGALIGLAGVIASEDRLYSYVMIGVTVLCLLELWRRLRSRERRLRELEQMLGCFREETMARRSTMRFILDEMLDDQDPLRAEVARTRQVLQASLGVASEFLEMLEEELRRGEAMAAERYLKEIRWAVTQSAALTDELGRAKVAVDQCLPSEVGSENRNTVSARKRLYSE